MLPSLSASRLSLFLECPRCFWLEHRAGISRPKTPFPSLPNGIDLVLKRRYDQYRQASTLPPELHGHIAGRLFDNAALLATWRDWRRGLRVRPRWAQMELTGALDDCLIDPDDALCPLDYKTRGSVPKPNTSSYYQHQLNIYALLLRESGYPTGTHGVLVYYYPLAATNHDAITFATAIERRPVNPDAARAQIEQATVILTGALPNAASSCGFCAWASQLGRAIPHYTAIDSTPPTPACDSGS